MNCTLIELQNITVLLKNIILLSRVFNKITFLNYIIFFNNVMQEKFIPLFGEIYYLYKRVNMQRKAWSTEGVTANEPVTMVRPEGDLMPSGGSDGKLHCQELQDRRDRGLQKG